MYVVSIQFKNLEINKNQNIEGKWPIVSNSVNNCLNVYSDKLTMKEYKTQNVLLSFGLGKVDKFNAETENSMLIIGVRLAI